MSYDAFTLNAPAGQIYSRSEEIYASHNDYLSSSSADSSQRWSQNGEGEARIRAGDYSGFKNIVEVEDVSIGSQNGMNSAAASWTPPVSYTHGSSSGFSNGSSHGHGEDHPNEVLVDSAEEGNADDIEALVEIFWNDKVYFVPESIAYAYDEEMGYPQNLEEDTGVEWAASSILSINPPKRTLQTIGVPEPIRQHFQQLDAEALKRTDTEEEDRKDIPSRYHSVFVLDHATAAHNTPKDPTSLNYESTLYKVVDRNDNQIYVLRRVELARNNAATIKSSISKWFEIRHPGIVSLYSINEDRGALFFTHAFHPGAMTLKQKFIDLKGPLLKETLIWRLFTQLISALRVVHGKGMVIRSITPQNVLLTSGVVARFNNVGVADIMTPESRVPLSTLKETDLTMLGYLLLSLACRTSVSTKNAEQAVLILQQHFSAELHIAVLHLLSGKMAASLVCHLISDKIHDEFDNAMAASDSLHGHLRNEFENGRMLRLLVKMGFINERPEYNRAPQWSETADRYVLKLFRDYVFHQALSDGAPVIDAGHVVTSLNKLDSSDSEQMLLSTRDNKDLLVVSFTDVRRCLESSYTDLDMQANQAQLVAPVNTSKGFTQGLLAQEQSLNLATDNGYYGGSNLGLSRRAAARLASISNTDHRSTPFTRARFQSQQSLLEKGRSGGGGASLNGNGSGNGLLAPTMLSNSSSSGSSRSSVNQHNTNSFATANGSGQGGRPAPSARSDTQQYQPDGPGLFASYALQQQRNLQMQQQLQQLQFKQQKQQQQQQQQHQIQQQEQDLHQRQQHQQLLQMHLQQLQQQQQIKTQTKLSGMSQSTGSGLSHARYAAQNGVYASSSLSHQQQQQQQQQQQLRQSLGQTYTSSLQRHQQQHY